jgi:hypothetical protein
VKTIIYILLLVVTIVIFQLISFLPWWAFVIPAFFIGIYMAKKDVTKMPFLTGFLAGFIVWAGATLFFHAQHGGNILEVLPGLLGMKKTMSLTVIGLIGAFLTGLAVLAGNMFFKKEDKEGLNIKMNA